MKTCSYIKIFFVCFSLLTLNSCKNVGSLVIDLFGYWGFKIDSFDQGLDKNWFKSKLIDTITLTGSMAINGKGNYITVHTHWTCNSHSNAIILDGLPSTLTQIVRVLDDWFKNRKTALLFEVKVSKGSLLMSVIDLHTNSQNKLEAKQLLYSFKKIYD